MNPIEWRPVSGYEGLYEVSSVGEVRSLPRRGCNGRVLRTTATRTGHRKLTLSKDGIHTTALVHHLVLDAFVGKRPDGCECAHNNGNPADNRIDNLRWDSHLNNIRDKAKHGTHKSHPGASHPMCVCSEEQVLSILNASESQTELAHKFGISQPAVSDIKTGRSWGWLTGVQYLKGNRRVALRT